MAFSSPGVPGSASGVDADFTIKEPKNGMKADAHPLMMKRRLSETLRFSFAKKQWSSMC